MLKKMEQQGITQELTRNIHTLMHNEGRQSIYYVLGYFITSPLKNPTLQESVTSAYSPELLASSSILI